MAKLKAKNLLVGGLCVLAVGLSAGAMIKTSRQVDTLEKVGAESFIVASLDETGKIDKEVKSDIVLSGRRDVKDLRVTLKENAKLDYVLYFFGEDNAFIETKTKEEFEEDGVPETAKKFNIKITPTNDEDGVVSAFEKFDYLKGIEIVTGK